MKLRGEKMGEHENVKKKKIKKKKKKKKPTMWEVLTDFLHVLWEEMEKKRKKGVKI